MGSVAQMPIGKPHDSNYVGKVDTNCQVLIDTLSFTFPLTDFKSKYKINDFASCDPDRLYRSLCQYFECLNLPFGLIPELRGGRNFFKHSMLFDNDSGFIAFGGNNIARVNQKKSDTETISQLRELEEKCQIYITGNGCVSLNDKHYNRIMQFIITNSGTIKRLDIAFDSFDGAYSIDDAIKWYREDGFQKSGRPPSAKEIKDFNGKSGDSFYVGNRANGSMFRAYEKGKQLGDETSDWVRLEVEIHSKDREIPLEALLNPAQFFAGAYPCLSFADKVQQIIKTAKTKLKIQYTELMVHAHKGYGRLINFMRNEARLSDEQIVASLINADGYPKRLRWVLNL